MDEYDKQAADFLTKTGSTFKAEFVEHGLHFPQDKTPRDIYLITLGRNGREFVFNFGQSIKDSGYYIDRDTKHRILCDGTRPHGLPRATPEFIQQFCSWGAHPPKRHGAKKPSAYSVLACLQATDPGDFEEFCDNFGYDNDSRTAMTTYKAVRAEFMSLERLYSPDELEALGEIC